MQKVLKYFARINLCVKGKLKFKYCFKGTVMQMWETVDYCLSSFSGLKHFQIFSREIRQSGSFLTTVATAIDFSSFFIKLVKINYCE